VAVAPEPDDQYGDEEFEDDDGAPPEIAVAVPPTLAMASTPAPIEAPVVAEVLEDSYGEEDFEEEEELKSPVPAPQPDRSNLKSAGASSVATRASTAASATSGNAHESDIDEVVSDEDVDPAGSPLSGGAAIPPSASLSGTSRPLVAADGRSYDYAEDPDDDWRDDFEEDDEGGSAISDHGRASPRSTHSVISDDFEDE
jgi:hypothetical protein